MRALDGSTGWSTIIAAMKFQLLTCARPGEVRLARRTEIDFDRARSRIPAERMKMRRQHDVPLSQQAIAVLREAWPLYENDELIFPSIQSHLKPLSENAMNSALRRMGYGKDEVTAHGFRTTAATILNERGYNPDVIEAALAHQHPNAVRRVYNRASYWPERVKLMQEWADLLDEFYGPTSPVSPPETIPAGAVTCASAALGNAQSRHAPTNHDSTRPAPTCRDSSRQPQRRECRRSVVS